MKELSDLEHCTEECRNCTGPRDVGGRLSDVCLYLQRIKAEAKISKTVPQVFECTTVGPAQTDYGLAADAGWFA